MRERQHPPRSPRKRWYMARRKCPRGVLRWESSETPDERDYQRKKESMRIPRNYCWKHLYPTSLHG